MRRTHYSIKRRNRRLAVFAQWFFIASVGGAIVGAMVFGATLSAIHWP